MTKIAEIIDLPERVHQGDFVLKLTAGVADPEGTLATYVVTPQLVECFDQALSLIRSAVETGAGEAMLHARYAPQPNALAVGTQPIRVRPIA